MAERIEQVWHLSPDFRDLIAELNAHGVEYLNRRRPRFGGPRSRSRHEALDVWVRPEPANAARVLAALRAFGAPLHDLTAEDLSTPGVVFQIGVAPRRPARRSRVRNRLCA
jgi:hypothetical protein